MTFDCPNNRYINDEEICQAITAMLARAGIETKLNALPRVQYFPKIQTSFYFVGILPTTHDAWSSLILHPFPRKGGSRDWNLGRYSNAKLDAAIDAIRVEMTPSKRNKLIEDALLFAHTPTWPYPLARAGDSLGVPGQYDCDPYTRQFS